MYIPSYLAGYRLGVCTVHIFKGKGYARGKGRLKETVRAWVTSTSWYSDSAKGFIDALLDSVN